MEKRVVKYLIHGDVCWCPTLDGDVLYIVDSVSDSTIVAKDEDDRRYLLKSLGDGRWVSYRLFDSEDGYETGNEIRTYYQYEQVSYNEVEEGVPFDEMESIESVYLPYFGR